MPKKNARDKLDKMKCSIILGCLKNETEYSHFGKEMLQGLAIHQLFVVDRGLEGEFEEYLNELQIDLKMDGKQNDKKKS